MNMTFMKEKKKRPRWNGMLLDPDWRPVELHLPDDDLELALFLLNGLHCRNNK